MGKALTSIAIGVAIVGLAVATGGVGLVGAGAVSGAGLTTVGGALAVSTTTALTTTALGSTLLIAGAGEILSGVAGGLAKKPSASAAQVSRTSPTIDPAAYRKTVYGRTAFPYDIRYYEFNGPAKDICDQVVCFASHKIHSVDEIWIGPELAWTSGAGTQGRFAGYFFADIFPEGGAGVGDTLEQGIWTSANHRLTGCAWGHFRFVLSGQNKTTDSPFASGLPSKVTIIGKGAMLYDSRRDDTVPGGAGPMRADDQSTWRFITDDGEEIGDNPALHACHRLLGWRINGKLAVGAGIPAKRLALSSFGVGASLCEEQVAVAAGGTEQRFRGAGVVSEQDDIGSSLNTILAGCCGRTRDDGGQISLWLAHNDLATAATDDGLFDDDVISAHTWISDGPLDQTPNIVSGKYTDARTTSLYQLLPYPDVRIDSVDGIDRSLPLDLSMVESVSQAQRVAKQTLERKQYSGRTFAATFDIRAWKYRIGSVVPLTYAPLSFERALFRVREMTPALTGCAMVLEAESADIYQWDASDAPAVQAPAPTVYDHKNNPLIQAIDAAAETADWPQVGDPIGTKPADNATNSRDPASPFGDSTVGEILAKTATVDQIFEGLGNTSAINIAKAALSDSAAEQMLVNLLLDDQAAHAANGAIAAARQEMTERAVGAEAVEAVARLLLIARMGSAEAAIVSNKAAILDLALGKASTSDLTAAISMLNGNIGAAITSSETEAGLTYAKAADLSALEASVDGAGGLSAKVTALQEVSADQDGKLKARFEETASVGGATAGVRAVVELSDGTLTTDLALVAQAVGIWIDRGDGTLVRLAYFEAGKVMIAGALEANSIETSMLNGHVVTIREEEESATAITGAGSSAIIAATATFDLPHDADVMISISGLHTYAGTPIPDYGVDIVLDDGTVIDGPAAGAGTVDPCFAMTRKVSMAAGTGRSASLRWRGGSSNITLKAGAAIVVDAAMA